MRNSYTLLLVGLGAVLSWACDSGESSATAADGAGSAGMPAASGGSGAGSPGKGGSAGAPLASAGSSGSAAGGNPGSGGSSGSGSAGAPATGLLLGTGGPFAYPHDKKPGTCSLTTAANASGAAQAAYNGWKSALVTADGAVGALRVRRNTDNDDTVSEGIGYGMIAAVYMNDRPTFDGLLSYAKAHFDANGLMNWHIGSGGSVLDGGMGSASDADEDMAWALVMASDQWSSAAYLADAKAMINAIYDNSIAGDGMLKPGDAWGGSTTMFPDYFAPSYYRVFAKVVSNPNWSGAIVDRNYAILAAVSGDHGLVPDKTTSSYDITGNYSYDACRTPWRITMDYCLNAEPRALAYLNKIAPFFDQIGAANIVDGYAPSGSQTSNYHNMAFIGPAGVAGMVAHQTLLDGAFAFGAANSGDATGYYPQSLRVLTMLMMSGNFVDFTRP